ncbi:lateral signaling target protein 2 homolog isoform X1 [Tympanuchus pallidicinctus]|uniref:lateral signaling target protein 2 homolog isoform X1 n=1 Tax=Tympanuchus pallidicinctus TaxID=109042 RepID=UPI002286DB74|nr:lateral signaling target protein 2 homolog isoform X1 [Tympanuchus pallidicinctus]
MLPAALRRWLHRPKRSDPRLLSQFFFADERVTRVVAEINGLDAELDPQQYLVLLNQLHVSQAQLLAVIEHIMEECIPTQRHSRDYLVKFPEELLVDNLGNHMLFAAECLLAGTFLEVEEADGAQLRPRARNLLCSLELVRALLREQSLSHPSTYPEPVRAALIQFDRLFAEFELSYVSSLVAVKSPDEIYRQQEIIVLFCETVERALRLGYLTQEMIDGYEPLLMFTIPRLAIISGLLIYPEGPLSLERSPEQMSRVFSPFYNLLMKIRDLLWVLSAEELCLLEKSLCAAEAEDPCSSVTPPAWGEAVPRVAPPALWGLLESPHTTPVHHSFMGRLGAVDNPCTESPQHPPGPRLETTLGSRCSELRSHYSSTEDMLHTLFVCISGVADQLQTNFASDLRSILKTVFKIVASPAETSEETGGSKDEDGELCAGDVPHVDDCPLCPSPRDATGLQRAAGAHRRPEWVPDSSSSHCSACRAPFTLLRRRHHCRSCGKIFCARCSPHTAALPHYGQPRPVRVCTHCHATHLPSWRSRTR